MSALADVPAVEQVTEPPIGYAPSPAGPADGEPLTAPPPGPAEAPLRQGLHFMARPMNWLIGGHRRYGDVWTMRIPIHSTRFAVTCHPDHMASLMKAKPADAPSLTGESPLRPLLGPNSVLTSIGDRHLRQRKLLLPPFHGEAIQQYVDMIGTVADEEIDRWPIGTPFALAPRMQDVTLAVIMRAVFGMQGEVGSGTPEDQLRAAVRRVLGFTTTPMYRLMEVHQAGHVEPRLPLRALFGVIDRHMYRVIAARRADLLRGDRNDVLSMLLQARDEEGQLLTDEELHDELMGLVLAGHETTANSLAWAFERLLRTPDAYSRLREEVRSGDAAASAAYVEATIHETMRSRPVIPMVVRTVKRRWRLGEFVIAADTPVAVSIIGLHHRDDVYPRPQEYRPERFLNRKPGTYTWIPFGGGIRRCLGATLAMAEQRVVLEAIARRTDLTAVDPAAEAPRMRNVTMIPGRGGRIVVTDRRSA
jgi:cytochrome P450